MVVKSSPRVMSRHEFLCAQRRLCADRRFHTFSLRFNGKIDADEASAFFKKCPELVFNIVSDTRLSCWRVYLNKR